MSDLEQLRENFLTRGYVLSRHGPARNHETLRVHELGRGKQTIVHLASYCAYRKLTRHTVHRTTRSARAP
jgi:hypothetical protein